MPFHFDRDLVGSLPELQRFARRLTRDPAQADDLVQDCVERALRNREKFEPGTNLEAWLVTIMKNLHFTRYQRERRITQTELAEDTLSTAPAQMWPIMVRETGEAIERLSPNHRQLIRIVAIDGRSYEEAAEELGVSIGTIRSRLSRARAELRSGDAVEPPPDRLVGDAGRPAPVTEPPAPVPEPIPEPAMATEAAAAREPAMAIEPTTAPAATSPLTAAVPRACGVPTVRSTSGRTMARRTGQPAGRRVVGLWRRPESRFSPVPGPGRRPPVRARPAPRGRAGWTGFPGAPRSRDGPLPPAGTATAAVPR